MSPIISERSVQVTRGAVLVEGCAVEVFFRWILQNQLLQRGTANERARLCAGTTLKQPPLVNYTVLWYRNLIHVPATIYANKSPTEVYMTTSVQRSS